MLSMSEHRSRYVRHSSCRLPLGVCSGSGVIPFLRCGGSPGAGAEARQWPTVRSRGSRAAASVATTAPGRRSCRRRASCCSQVGPEGRRCAKWRDGPISPASLYTYFAGRDELLSALLTDSMRSPNLRPPCARGAPARPPRRRARHGVPRVRPREPRRPRLHPHASASREVAPTPPAWSSPSSSATHSGKGSRRVSSQ